MLQTPAVSQFLLSVSLRLVRFQSGIKVNATDWKMNPFSFSASIENAQVGYDQMLISSRRVIVQFSPIALLFGKVQVLEVSLQDAWMRGRLTDSWLESSGPNEFEYSKTDVPLFVAKKLKEAFLVLKKHNLDLNRIAIDGLRSDLIQAKATNGHVLFEKLSDDQAIVDVSLTGIDIPSQSAKLHELGVSVSLTKDFNGTYKLGIQNFNLQQPGALQLSMSGSIPGSVRLESAGSFADLNLWLKNWDALSEKPLLESVSGSFSTNGNLQWNSKQVSQVMAQWESKNLVIDGFEPGHLKLEAESRSEDLKAWAFKNLSLVIPHQILGGPKIRIPKNQFFAEELLLKSNMEVSGQLRVNDVELCDVLYATYVDECFQSLYTNGVLRLEGRLDPFQISVHPQLKTTQVDVRSDSFHLDHPDSHLLTSHGASVSRGVVDIRTDDLLLKRVEVSFDGQSQPALVDGRIQYSPSEVDLDIEANKVKLESILKEFLGVSYQGEGNIQSKVEFRSKTKSRAKLIRVTNQVEIPNFAIEKQVLGEVKGPVSFLNQRLQIGPLKVKQGGGLATVHGSLLRRPNQNPMMNFDGKFRRIEMKTFSPESNDPFFKGFISGDFNLRTDLSGDLTGPINAQIENFQAFGLPFQSAILDAQYKNKKLFIEDLLARRGSSIVHLAGILNPDGGTELKFSTQEFPIVDIELDSAFRNFSKGKVRLEGMWNPTSGWNLKGSAFDLELAGRTLPETNFSAQGQGDRIQVKASSPEFLNVDYEGVSQGKESKPLKLDLAMKDEGLYAAMAYLKKWRSPQPVQTKGSLSLHWMPQEGELKLDKLVIKGPVGTHAVTKELLSVPDIFRVQWASNKTLAVEGSIEGATKLSASTTNEQKSLKLEGQIPMALLGLFIPNVQIYQGQASLRSEIPMPPNIQTLRGDVSLKDGIVGIRGIGQNVENLTGKLGVSSGVIDIIEGDGRLGSGTVNLSGNYRLSLSRPAANLRLRLDRANLVLMDDLPLKVSGDLTLAGENFPYRMAGQVSVLEAVYSREFESEESFATQAIETPSLEFFINADLSNETQLRNSTIQGKMSGRLDVAGNDQNAYVVGRMEFLNGGKLLANQHEFDITQGIVDFPQESRTPIINLQGTTKVRAEQDYRVDLTALGPANQLNLQFTSDPTLSTNDIVQLLAFGYISKETRAADAEVTSSGVSRGGETAGKDSSLWSQEGSVEALQALFGKAIGGRLQKSTGFDVGVKGQRNGSGSTEGSTAKVVVGKKISERLSATFGQSLETTLPQQDVKVDYKLFNNVNLSGVWENKTENNVQDTSVGVDLRFRFEFK